MPTLWDTYLRDKGHKLAEVVSLLVGVDLEDLPDAFVVVPLLEKFLAVRGRVTFDQVLQLRQIRGE